MRDNKNEPETPGPQNTGDRSLLDDVETLIDDGRTFVEAELKFQKARLSYAGSRGTILAIAGALAAVFLVFALFAIVFGTILALSPRFGPILATLIVAGTLVIASAIGLYVAAFNWRKIRAAFTEDDL